MSDKNKNWIIASVLFSLLLFYLLIGRGNIFSPAALFTPNYIIYGLRLPRLIMAIGVGGLLAVSGHIMQRITKNPLASPDVIGLSSGASFGAILFLYIYMDPRNNSILDHKYLALYSFFFSLLVLACLSLEY